MRRPTVFLGPSLPTERARGLLDADYHPPVRRGDLPAAVRAGATTVLIIDGEFAQELAVSVAEIRDALRAGVRVWGASSMGALRAAECATLGMRGVGQVYAAYAAGRVEADDEVALLFDPRTLRAITVPLVNVRWQLDLAARAGRVAPAEATALLAHAAALHFTERTPAALRAPADAALAEPAREVWGAAWEDDRFDRKRLDAIEALRLLASDAYPVASRRPASVPSEGKVEVHMAAKKKVTAKKATAKKATAKKATAKKASAKKATAKKASAKKASAKKASAKRAAPKKATAKRAAPKKATAKRAAPKKKRGAKAAAAALPAAARAVVTACNVDVAAVTACNVDVAAVTACNVDVGLALACNVDVGVVPVTACNVAASPRPAVPKVRPRRTK